MSGKSDVWLLLPRPLRRLPSDLTGVALLVVATGIAVFVPGIRETPLRVVLGLPFVLFLPGYAFVAALFPEQGRLPADETESDEASAGRIDRLRRGSIDGIERIALSFGLSIAISPLIGLVLNFTPFGIRLGPVVVAIGGFTLVVTGVAAVRRDALPAEERFRVPFRQWYSTTRTELFEPETRTDQLLNVVLIISLVLAVSSVAYAVAVPRSGESFTEFYLLTQNESGALTAANYPSNLTEGNGEPLVIGVTNHEHHTEQYTIVSELQRVNVANNSTTVVKREPVNRFQTQLSSNQTWTHHQNVTPSMTGTHLRLIYLLYKGDLPNRPTAENAYRETHLWVNVSSSA